MNKCEKQTAILICNSYDQEIVKSKLQWYFNIICKNKQQAIINLIRTKQICVVISFISGCNDPIISVIERTCICFPNLPMITIIKDSSNIELIRKCGEIGINSIILLSDSIHLEDRIHELIQNLEITVTIREIGIDIKEPPEIMRRALSFMESNYTKIMCIEEVINYLGTTYKTLSSLFKQTRVINPKAVLMFLKVRHSLYLLQQNNLSIEEISYKSGFSNKKRFSECFRRMFDKSARECLCEINKTSIDNFWLNNLKYKLLYCKSP